MVFYPIVLAQMQMQVTTDGKDAPTYFASADEVREEMKIHSGGAALPTSKVVLADAKVSSA